MRSLEKELPTLITLPQFECPCAKHRTVLGPGLGYLGKTGSRGGGDGVRELTTCGASLTCQPQRDGRNTESSS